MPTGPAAIGIALKACSRDGNPMNRSATGRLKQNSKTRPNPAAPRVEWKAGCMGLFQAARNQIGKIADVLGGFYFANPKSQAEGLLDSQNKRHVLHRIPLFHILGR